MSWKIKSPIQINEMKYVNYNQTTHSSKAILDDIKGNGGFFLFLFYDTYTVIKSPRYTGGDFMFLYRFVRHHYHRPQSCSRDNFCTTFQISFISGRIHGPDL